jgi:hypothetical protein
VVRAVLMAVGLAVTFAAPAPADDWVIEVLHVRNRPASDLVAPLEAMLGADVTVTAYQGKLLVRAARSRFPAIRQLVQQLDVQARSLWITVSQGKDLQASDLSAEAAIVAGSAGVAAPGSVSAAQGTEQDQDTHRLRALEGTRAFITLGQSVPVDSLIAAPVPGGVTLIPGTSYQQGDRGFWVVARVSGSLVTLEIETALDEAHPGGGLERQSVSTTMSGQLGVWLSLGEIGRESAASGSGILSASQASRSELRTVRVKVEEIR